MGMDYIDYRNLRNGLYYIYWKSGGSSLASIGMLRDGGRWIAPTNWSSPSENQDIYKEIDFVITIAPKQNIIKRFKGWLSRKFK
jgi:hypothetical protein